MLNRVQEYCKHHKISTILLTLCSYIVVSSVIMTKLMEDYIEYTILMYIILFILFGALCLFLRWFVDYKKE